MRVGVIRGDLPGPVTLEDLETVSQFNPPTEPYGQARHVGRPDPTLVGTAMLGVGATVIGTVDLVAGSPITINNGNHTLRVKTASAASFTVVTVANAAYATAALLVAAVNTALTAASVSATARLDNAGTHLVLRSNTGGVGSYIAVDSVGGGSTFNTPVGLAVGGDSFTVPAATAVITATLPVGGPLDVSAATLATQLGAGVSTAEATAVADVIAPHFIETDVAIKSFQVGMLSGFRSATYTPDPTRLPALALGAAVSVVQDDGTSAFVAALTVITGAAHNSPNSGDITITGTNLGVTEDDKTVVRVESGTTTAFVRLNQKVIRTTLTGGTQGSVAPTSIVIPASLLAGLGIVGSKARVQYTSLASNLFTVT
jgi:hypothetical protein